MQTPMAALMTCLVLWSGAASAQPQHGIEVEDETAVHRFQTPGMSGYIDTSGNLLVPSIGKWNHLCGFHEGLAAVEIAYPRSTLFAPQHWGFVDKTGKLVIPDKFQYAGDFHEGLAAVNVGGKPNPAVDFIHHPSLLDHSGRRPCYPVGDGAWGFVDRRGEFVIPPTYRRAKAFSDGLALVRTADECLFIDKSGNPIIRLPKESYPRSFSEGRAAYKENGRYGYLDRSGRKAIPAIFVAAQSFSSGLACVLLSDGGKWGHINKSGAVVIEPRFEKPISFREGMAAIPIDGKYGFIDIRGNMAIQPQFEMTHGFNEGLAPVKMNGKWGYIDQRGKWLIAARFVGAGWFRRGIARVAVQGKWGFIDKTGEFVIEPYYDLATDFWDGMAFVRKCARTGLKNAAGEVLLEPRFFRIAAIRRWDVYGKRGLSGKTGA